MAYSIRPIINAAPFSEKVHVYDMIAESQGIKANGCLHDMISSQDGKADSGHETCLGRKRNAACRSTRGL